MGMRAVATPFVLLTAGVGSIRLMVSEAECDLVTPAMTKSPEAEFDTTPASGVL